MRRPDFDAFRSGLLRSGVAPRNVDRAVLELGEHFDDLVEEAIAAGMSRSDAEDRARDELGDLELIAGEIAARPELRSWAWQHPRLAVVCYPLACMAVLPAVPLSAGGLIGIDGLGWVSPSFHNTTKKYELESTAAFGELYYSLNEQLKLTAGARYTRDKKTVNDAA